MFFNRWLLHPIGIGLLGVTGPTHQVLLGFRECLVAISVFGLHPARSGVVLESDLCGGNSVESDRNFW